MSFLSEFNGGSFWYRGEYDPAVKYFYNNTVGYNGAVYLCVNETTGHSPVTSYFTLLTAALDVSVSNLGSGTDIEDFAMYASGSTIVLNRDGEVDQNAASWTAEDDWVNTTPLTL